VVFSIRRPEGVAGRTATIDQSTLTVRPGKRATDTTLSLQLRSSQGGQRTLVLPDGAQLQSVKVAGTTQPIRQEGARVTLPVVPGAQSYELVWREMQGISAVWSTPVIDLDGPSVNARVRVEAPPDRWSLWFDGPRLGPAVLFWGVLSVLVLVSILLGIAGRRHFPVGVATWLLLGLGLTQVSVFGLLAIVGWFVAIRYRALVMSDGQPRCGPAAFNLLQFGIVVLSVIGASVLLGAVQNGLLGHPEMQIQGNDSSAYTLNWTQDRVSGTLPQATVYSVPLWVYRLLMMAWALWLAFSVLAWIRWGWRAFADGGLWRTTPVKWTRWRRRGGQGEAVRSDPTG
jgi:hypothetical protein